MTSETHTRYGSRVSRHGSARRCRRYHASSERRSSAVSRTSPFDRSTREPAMSDSTVIRQHFTEMLQRPDAQIDLARAALLVAAENDPTLDVDTEMARLEQWARELRERIDPSFNNLQRLARLRTFMYEDLGFKGDVRGYYSPDNSLLHSVMSRRLGIPLTLSIVFMEIGWRIGVPFEGVGFPGHFLVRRTGEPGDLLLDPYDHGAS